MSAELWFAIISLALGAIGAVFSILASVIAYFVKRGEDAQDKAIDVLHKEHVTLRGDVDNINQTLARYEAHIGAGHQDLTAIKTDLKDHVIKEEQIFWKKMEAISEAHKVFAEAVLQRMASMEARLPNGELQKMAIDMAKLVERLEKVQKQSEDAVQHVRDHNEEAERWKRQIEVDAKRLDLLEQRQRDFDDSNNRVRVQRVKK